MLTAGVRPQMYPAMRDAKAAVRWVRANAEQYNAAPEYITAIGGSAGAVVAIGIVALVLIVCKRRTSKVRVEAKA